MARRSPTNERYQKSTAPAGKTRRSAASAKPKRSGESDSAPVKSTGSAKGKPAADAGSGFSAPPAHRRVSQDPSRVVGLHGDGGRALHGVVVDMASAG